MSSSNHENELAPEAPSEGGFWALRNPALWLIASICLLGLYVVPVFWPVLNFDIGLNIYLADSMLHGAKLYVDYLETNPPLILWMTVPGIVLGRLLGLSLIDGLRLYQVLVGLGGIALCWAVLQRTGLLADILHRRIFLVALGFAYFPLSAKEFGQREWYLIVLIMPYLLLNAARAVGYKPSGKLSLLVGVLAAIGFSIKPFFVLVWLGLEIYLTFFRKAGFFFRRNESLIVVIWHCLYYLILIPVLYPEYYPLLRMVSQLYTAYNLSLWSVLENTFNRSPEFYYAILILLVLRPLAGASELRRMLAVAMAGLMLVVLVQQKGWDYHLYPVNVAAVCLLVISALAFCRNAPEVLAFLRPRGAVVAGLLLAVLAGKSFVRAQDAWWSRLDPKSYFGQFVEFFEHNAKGRPIVMFATQLDPAFPVVNYAQATWGFRYPFLWMLPGLYNGTGVKQDGTIYRTRAEMSGEEKFLVDSVVKDLQNSQPAFVLVDTSKNKVMLDVNFDYIEYFSRDPRFAALWKNYHPITNYYALVVYARNDIHLVH